MIQSNKISIVITTYNRPGMILETLQSIYDDDYLNREIIVVDDCSDVEYDLDHYGIKYLRHEKNMGLSFAKNTGIDVCTGEYVKFVDDDDKLIPGQLKIQVQYLDDHPDVGVVYSDILKFNETGIISRMKGGYQVPAGSMLIRRSVFDRIRWSEKHSGKGEDSILWKEIREAGHGFDYLEMDSIYYRDHDDQFTKHRVDTIYAHRKK
jgi:glycosyltransferase involved in cell wall biosynthesis